MTLFKTSLWTGASTLFKAFLMYIMWKVIAIYTGPTGIALVEQFQNFLQISRSSVLCGVNQAVVKYVAEYKNSEAQKSTILSNAMLLNLIFCFLIAIILCIFSPEISVTILQSTMYKKLIILVAASTILFAINNLGLSILNGEREVKKYVVCIIVNTILNFFLTSYLVIHFGFYGGLVGFVFNQSLVAFFTLYFVIKCRWFKLKDYFKGINLDAVTKLIQYSLMVFTTTLIVPICLIIVRKYIASTLQWESAGYWQGIMRLSSGYLIVMNMVLSFYLLPKFSETKTRAELKKEVFNSYMYIFPLILLGTFLIFILKKPIVIIMYSSQFLPMLVLFKYQLIGDIARMSAWLLSNILLAKAMIKVFVGVEVFFSLTYVALTIVLVHYFGLIGSAIGFAVNYVLYWLFMIFFSLWYLNGERDFKREMSHV